MNELFSRFFRKGEERREEETKKGFLLVCDFGYDITSPIPSVEPVHENSHCTVPAVAGTSVRLFGEKGHEIAEFLSPITDEEGRVTGMKCRIRQDPKIYELLGIPVDPGWEVDLVCGKAWFADDSRYENGKNTHTYRRLLLTDKQG